MAQRAEELDYTDERTRGTAEAQTDWFRILPEPSYRIRSFLVQGARVISAYDQGLR